jgi:hypothetical protein
MFCEFLNYAPQRDLILLLWGVREGNVHRDFEYSTIDEVFFHFLRNESRAEGVRVFRGSRVWVIGWVDGLGTGDSVLLLFGGGGGLLNRPGVGWPAVGG